MCPTVRLIGLNYPTPTEISYPWSLISHSWALIPTEIYRSWYLLTLIPDLIPTTIYLWLVVVTVSYIASITDSSTGYKWASGHCGPWSALRYPCLLARKHQQPWSCTAESATVAHNVELECHTAAFFPPEHGTRTVRILHPVFDVVVRVSMAPVTAEEDIVSLGTVKMPTIYFGIIHDGRHCQSECSREYILRQTTSVWQSSLTRGREIPTFPVPITHTSQIPEILDRTYVCISLVIS